MLGIRFHRYLYKEGENIEFIETEIPDTGQGKDIAVKVDGRVIMITEFMAKALYNGKLMDLFDYHQSARIDPQYKNFEVRTNVVSIANPHHGKNKVEIDKNITFHVDTIFTKQKDGWKVLNSLIYKTITQEELSDEDAIDLLLLPDMDIEMPIKALMKMIIVIMGKVNIADVNFKEKLVLCEIQVLARFFKNDELSEMIEMLTTETKQSEVERIIEKYGQGFDVIYFDGKADGKLEVVINLIKNGFDEEVISINTGLSIDQIRNIKRKL